MKKHFAVSLSAALTAALLAVPAAAEETDVVYGTMQIPYAAFYAAEGVDSEVDAVSSATESKWKNEGLVGGTYNEPHTDDAGGDILGVVYPVAISAADLEALGEDNYGFAALEEVPAAYKTVTVADGTAAFSAVEGERSVLEAEVSLTTESRYGDYQIDVKSINNADGTSDIGTIYGVLLTTEEGNVYALRHLENIWRDALAWSSGVKTTEGHGNTLNFENYVDLMGQTLTGITYITETGYHDLAAELYLPIKFDGSVEVASVPAADGAAALSLNDFPEDYAPAYAIKGLDFAVEDGQVTWEDALPGAYGITVSDEEGVYADVLADFVLSTDQDVAAYDADAKAIIAADDVSDELLAAFLKNIATVSVGEEAYSATGKGAVLIIDADGLVDAEAAVTTGRGADAVTTPIFAEAGDYEITVNATGFDIPLSFTFTVE